MPRLIIPKWYDDALLLKAQGLTTRQISKALIEAGHKNASHQNVWFWTTPQGFTRLKKLRRIR